MGKRAAGVAPKQQGAAPRAAPSRTETAAGLLPAGHRHAEILVVRPFGETEPGHHAVAETHVVLVDGLELGSLSENSLYTVRAAS